MTQYLRNILPVECPSTMYVPIYNPSISVDHQFTKLYIDVGPCRYSPRLGYGTKSSTISVAIATTNDWTV